MSHLLNYAQECPVCGRPLEIRVEYLGHPVSCRHCGGEFVASAPAGRPNRTTARTAPSLLKRAEMLLRLSSQRLALAGGLTPA